LTEISCKRGRVHICPGIRKRYEKGSIFLTSNKSYGDWGSIFADKRHRLGLPGTNDQGGSQAQGTFSGTQLISVNGQRRQDNNFTMHGVDNNFMMMNSPGMSPSMDAIQEFRVLDNTSAEFGRSSGSNVNIVIKSGSHDLHGSAFEYFRNDKRDANDFFANKQGTGKVPFPGVPTQRHSNALISCITGFSSFGEVPVLAMLF